MQARNANGFPDMSLAQTQTHRFIPTSAMFYVVKSGNMHIDVGGGKLATHIRIILSLCMVHGGGCHRGQMRG